MIYDTYVIPCNIISSLWKFVNETNNYVFKLTVNSSPKDITLVASASSGGSKPLHGVFPYSLMISHSSFISVQTLAWASAPRSSVIDPGTGLKDKQGLFLIGYM